MVRQVTDDDIGLKVLRDTPAKTARDTVDIVAVHGLGAHPDDSWRKNIGTAESPQLVNWLVEENMLPAVAPHARIMRYGYESQWFGEAAMQQKVSTVAQRLLKQLKRRRKDYSFRPLLFISHCFGGLVVLKALIEAQRYENEWPGVFESTTGLIFFGTPFRGAEGMSQVEMLEAAQREYKQDEIQINTLQILQPGNEFLQEVVDQFGKTRGLPNKAHVACFYELKSSNVGRIVGNENRTRFVVSESSGCLDLSEGTKKYSLSRTHFNMNKFGKPTEEDFETVSEVIEEMIEASQKLMVARKQCEEQFKVKFSLKGVPMGNFAERPKDTQALEQALLPPKSWKKQQLLVLHGLGGMGKTHLAANFAQQQQHRFSSVLWLDGSSQSSLKQSFASFASRIKGDQVSEATRLYASRQAGDLDAVVKDVLGWLSIRDNRDWLLVIDNVDGDYDQPEKDAEVYAVGKYLPKTNHGSVLITTQLQHLCHREERWEVKKVGKEQAQIIFKMRYGKNVGREGDELLELLEGLPLALVQAAAYMRETGVDFRQYTCLYKKQRQELTLQHGAKQPPLRNYANESMATTWNISYRDVEKRNRAAAGLLLLWAHLDNKSMWYGLLATASRKSDVAARITSAYLCNVARSEREFTEAVRMLRSYSLVEETHDLTGYSMHPVVHQWVLRMQSDRQRTALSWLAIILVGLAVPIQKEKDYWGTQARLLPHAERCEKGEFGKNMTDQEAKSGIAELRENGEVLLSALKNLGLLYASQRKLDKAERMYKRVLLGLENTFGRNHTTTLSMVHHMGALYQDQGKLDQAEVMFMQALKRSKVIRPEMISTYVPALKAMYSRGLLYGRLNRNDEARTCYSEALSGYEKVYGEDHPKCQQLRELLFALNDTGKEKDKRGEKEKEKEITVAGKKEEKDDSPSKIAWQEQGHSKSVTNRSLQPNTWVLLAVAFFVAIISVMYKVIA